MMQPWFADAKLGIFIHWGIYAVDGIPESWAFFTGSVPYDQYMRQTSGFTADKYDPEQWADLFARAGARYAVLTSKHHDGVALFDTQLSDLSTTRATPAARDLIAPYCEALRRHGLKVGLYFSHLDWSHPDYASVPVGERTAQTLTQADYDNWDGGPNNPAWQRFVQFHRGQLHELCTGYGPLDLLWFDGNWTPTDTPERDWWHMRELRDQLHAWQSGVILNSRMNGYGDYDTPEQGLPIARPSGPWEFCVTVNDSWGYQTHDTNYKSVRQIVRLFCEVIGMGGNLLLDVGPLADGTIPAPSVERLEGLGAWITKHQEAVYATDSGLPHGHVYGTSTLSHDRRTLYVFFFDRVVDSFAVKGIRNPVTQVSVVGSGEQLKHRTIGGAPWAGIPGILWIDVPEHAHDPNATVLKIELDGPLDLYTGSGHAIEQN